MNFSEMKAKVCQHNLDNFVNCGMATLWKIWRMGQLRPEDPKHRHHCLTRNYGPRLLSIILGCGNVHRSKLAKSEDFYKLSNEYLEVDDELTSKGQAEKQLQAIQCLLCDSPFKKIRLSKKLKGLLGIRLWSNRLMRSQHHLTHYQHISLIERTHALMTKLGQSRNEKHLEAYRKLKNFLQLTPEEYPRIGFAIFTSMLVKHDSRFIGVFDLNTLNIENDIRNKLNIDHAVLQLFTTRVSGDKFYYQKWYNDHIEPLPCASAKWFVEPLFEKPLVSLVSYSNPAQGKNVFLCPSPWHFSWNISLGPIQYLHNLKTLEDSQLGANILGEIAEELLEDFLVFYIGRENVEKIPKGKEKMADFVCNFEGSSLIIECKKSLGSYKSKAILSPQDTINIWSNLHEASEQVRNTWNISSHVHHKENSASVVVYYDALMGEADLFKLLNLESDLLDLDVGIEYLGIEEFEKLLINIGPKNLVKVIQTRHHKILEGKKRNQNVFELANLVKWESIEKQMPPFCNRDFYKETFGDWLVSS